jgi:hypothetical protein
VALFLKPDNHLVRKPPAGVVEVQDDRRSEIPRWRTYAIC